MHPELLKLKGTNENGVDASEHRAGRTTFYESTSPSVGCFRPPLLYLDIILQGETIVVEDTTILVRQTGQGITRARRAHF